MSPTELSKILAIPELPDYIRRINQSLEAAVKDANPALRDPALRIIGGGGKRLRPMLVIAAAATQGKKITDHTIAAATAIEFVHLGSLIHDDIMDHADTRGGVETINSKENIATAILAGDYFLALGAAQAASVSKEAAAVVANVIATMTGGQSREAADQYNPNRSVEDYLITIRQKTAALMSAACQVGALSADAPAETTTALGEYGEAFGTAFQLTDDLLDLLATQETMGKPVANDLTEGVYTLPILLALQTQQKEVVRSWLGEGKTPPKNTIVLKALIEAGTIEQTFQQIQQYNHAAIEALSSLEPSPVTNGLMKLPDIYTEWTRDKMVML